MATNGDVRSAARILSGYNRPATLEVAIYPLAVQFPAPPGRKARPISGLKAMHASGRDPGGEVRSDSTGAPTWMCMVTVYAHVIHQSPFSSTIDHSTMGEIARATARILLTAPSGPGNICRSPVGSARASTTQTQPSYVPDLTVGDGSPSRASTVALVDLRTSEEQID